MAETLWFPSEEEIAFSQLANFQHLASASYGREMHEFNDLYQWSVEEPEEFWGLLWEFCEPIYSEKYDKVLVDKDKMLAAKWFPGARLNFAENLLRFRDDKPAILFSSERGEERSLTYRELYNQVAKLAAVLKQQGIGKGDRVLALMPNLPETVIAMLAATSLGAIWSSSSLDFGLEALKSRFEQIEPKAIFFADGYTYNGKEIDCSEKLNLLFAALPSLESAFFMPFLNAKAKSKDFKLEQKLFDLPEILLEEKVAEMNFEQVPFDHPLYILFSSGTTGKPKCIVHSVGGTLFEHLKELRLHLDLRREDKIFYATTCAWMMWNWLLSSLALGSSIVLYEGSPFSPHPGALLELVEKKKISVFGTSAKYLLALEKKEIYPAQKYELSSLRMICSTGSPLLPESFDFVYNRMKSDLCLASISGGTDILGCFALANVTLPVERGELQARSLGMHVQVFDPSGKALLNEPGELVCTNPFPSMPVFFWGDEENKLYQAAYFDRYPNVWCHGDWAQLSDKGSMIIYGRSDSTLNPGGIRIGSAEIYNQVEKIDEIEEALVVGQAWEGDERILLFLKMKEGEELGEDLKKLIAENLKTECSFRHVPAKILSVPEIPKTMNGKISEIAVKNLINGRKVSNKEALMNPDALNFFTNLELDRC